MARRMTDLSYQLFIQAQSGSMTAAEAVEYLEKYAKIRTLSEKLAMFYDGDDLKKTLMEGLVANHPDKSKETLRKTVNNWLSGKSKDIGEEYAISLCFILRLSLENADHLYSLVTGMPFHWRNPNMIAYLYALQKGMDYASARNLSDRLKGALPVLDGEYVEAAYTPAIRREISMLRNEEELVSYAKAELHRLGMYHNTAYDLFMRMMDQLANPTFSYDVPQEQGLSVKQILQDYLYEGHIDKQGIAGEIQRLVAEQWPDEPVISKMKSRKMDVSRKVMILLFLATDEGLIVDELEEKATTEERFEDLYSRLDAMLIRCSFASLDPRVPFDWLVLYCIYANNMEEVDQRMRVLFDEMFGQGKSLAKT